MLLAGPVLRETGHVPIVALRRQPIANRHAAPTGAPSFEHALALTARETAERSLRHGAHNRIRTDDLVLTKNALCRLSYVGQSSRYRVQ